MSAPESYQSWEAIASAMKAAAVASSRGGGRSVDRTLALARFDRFLARVFADGAASPWLLKGGTSILARVPDSRSTKDVDLASPRETLDEAVADLREAAARDVGDHLRFDLVSQRPGAEGDTQPGVKVSRLVFTAEDAQTGRKIGTVPVDMVIGPPPVGQVEVVEPAHRLQLGKPLPAPPYRLYPVADQIADKVCATMTVYAGGRRSSRTKDLVDLVTIARSQRVDLDQLRLAIETKRVMSNLDQFDELTVPPGWSTFYRKLAADSPATGPVDTLAKALEITSQMVNPALAPQRSDGPLLWVPHRGWLTQEQADSTAPIAPAMTTDDEDGRVRVRAHQRSGHPVRQHDRAPRGRGRAAD